MRIRLCPPPSAAVLLLAAIGSWWPLQAAAQPADSIPPTALRASDDGTLVIDPQARQAWARCVEGMRWNGQTCTGQPTLVTYAQAQALAQQRGQAEGVRWRLPRVPELRRLVRRNARPPSVDAALFPAAPATWHWSGTASVNAQRVNPYAYDNAARGGQGEHQITVRHAWAVDMGSSEANGQTGRSALLAVRLIRPFP